MVEQVNAVNPALDDINFNALLIVESLGHQDKVKTGGILRDYTASLVDELGMPVSVMLERVEDATEFAGLLQNLSRTIARSSLRPILHIECHGGDRGLCFADGSCMPWATFCDLLTPINRLLELRLMVVVAACFGMSILNGVSLKKAAPCFAMVGPTDEVNPGEVMGRFRLMYRSLFTTLDGTKTYQALTQDRLELGGMVLLTSVSWFGWLMSNYLENHATPRAAKALALRQHMADKAVGRFVGMAVYKRLYRERFPKLARSYFEAFFMYADLHTSQARFESCWSPLQSKIDIALRRF